MRLGLDGAAPPPPRIHPFFNAVEREVPAAELIHTVLDNRTAHKHAKVLTPIGSPDSVPPRTGNRSHTRSPLGVYPPMRAM